jgi:TonB family protein
MAALHDRVPSRDSAIEVVVMWGEDPTTADLLHVGYVPAEGHFAVGDAVQPDGSSATDYLIAREQLGLAALPIVIQSDRGPLLVVPMGSSLRTVSDRGEPRTAAQLLLDDALCASGNPTFPFALPLRKGESAWLSYRGFTFFVRPTVQEQPIAGSRAPDWKDHRMTAVSLLAHLFVLGLFYYAAPVSPALAADAINVREKYLDYLLTPKAIELEPLPDEGGGTPSDSDEAPSGEPGTNGEPTAKAPRAKKTLQASKKSDVEPTQEELRELASQAGLIGVLRSSAPVGEGQYNAVSASGFDAHSSLASLLANQDGPSFGHGLGPIGLGRGAGGTAAGTVAAGFLKTMGGKGPGTGGSGNYGAGVGSIHGRGSRLPPVRHGVPQIVGGLSKEVIRRTIHRNLNQVRFCYEQALQVRPDIQGRVAVRFIIGATGEVKVAAIESSSIGDARVESCISSAVKRWTFPAPDGAGIVAVTYPFVLEQVGQ